MTEITDQIPKYGQYNHRGDMSEVKRLMETWGVGGDFNAVVMQSGRDWILPPLAPSLR
jgi:hypothetical protein